MTASPVNFAGTSDNGDDPGRQRKRGAELEQAIKDATIAELACGGYGNVTIESVAARAQTGKASIYRRWPTKQELVMDSLGCLLAGPLLSIDPPRLEDTVTTRDALLMLLRQVVEVMTGPGGEAMRSIMSESLRDPDFSMTFECDYFDPRKQVLVDLLERGVARGEVRADAVTPLLPEIVAGTLTHRVIMRRQPISDEDLVELLDRFLMPAISPR